MLKLRLSIILIFFYQLAFAQNFEWAKSFGSNYSESGNSIVTDTSGNVYTIGVFMGEVDFDPNLDSSFIITSNDYTTDVFINKFNASGKFIWAKRIGGKGYDEGTSIAIDAEQNLYITGLFEDSADFDPSGGEEILVSTENSQDVFVAKYNLLGDLIWARSMGGNSFDIGKSIHIDKFGNVLVSGYFVDVADFNPKSGHYFLSAQGYFDAFLMKLNKNGALQWARGFGGPYYDISYSVSSDLSGNIYLAGQFQDTLIYQVVAPNKLASQGADDMFIIKLNTLGNVLWAKSMGGSQTDIAYSIAVDKNYNIYSTGQFQATVDFDPGNGISNLSALKTDVFISKLDSGGNFLWAKSFKSTSYSGIGNGFDIDFDNFDNVCLAGLFSNTFDFDPDTTTFLLNSSGSSGVFVAKLSAEGAFVWAVNYAAMGNITLTIDRKQNIYLTGEFKGSVDFNPGILVFTLYAGNDYDAYILKLSSLPDGAGSISGLTLQCPGTIAIYSIPPAFGASYYIWSLPDEAQIIEGQNTNTISVKFGTASGFISVTPFNIYGPGAFSSQAITIKPMSKMGFTINNESQCLTSNSFLFTDTTNTSDNYRRAWYINNENSTLPSFNKTLSKTGIYKISLIGTNKYYCYDTINKTVEVNPMPKADFFVDNNSQCLNNNAFKFNNLSSVASGETFSIWNFGSSVIDTSTIKNPTKTYISYGNYLVKLVSITDKHCTDTLIKSITVLNSPTIGQIQGQMGVNTDILYSYYVKDSVGLNYKWTIVNGIIVSGQGTSHVQVKWLSIGSGSLKLELTNALNCKDIENISVSINKVGLEDIEKITEFEVYPNPNHGDFSMKLNIPNASQTRASIFNTLGQEIWMQELELSKGSQLINIQTNLNKGVYVLKIFNAEAIHSKTILIE